MRNLTLILAGLLVTLSSAGGQEPGIEFFEKKIRPVLAEHCYECHATSARKVRGGLLLDSRDGWRKGGESGAVLEPGHPEKSLLIKALRHTDDSLKMPPRESCRRR